MSCKDTRLFVFFRIAINTIRHQLMRTKCEVFVRLYRLIYGKWKRSYKNNDWHFSRSGWSENSVAMFCWRWCDFDIVNGLSLWSTERQINLSASINVISFDFRINAAHTTKQKTQALLDVESLYDSPIVSQCDLNNFIVIFTITEAKNCTENHHAWNNCYAKNTLHWTINEAENENST